jgi:dihydroxyacetone kinase-like predicted kinase
MMSARQVVSLTPKEVYVVPADTMPQGIAALIGFNYSADFETNCKVMTVAAQSISTAEITTAVRSVQLGNVRVREGDYIGIVNGNLAIAGQDMEYVLNEALKRMQIEQLEIVTLYYGEGVTEQAAEATARRIKSNYSQLEIQVVNGGQAHYSYIISAE